jgi:hypothetical protein
LVHLVGVSTVFVPFEVTEKGEIKRDDLPRFLTSGEAAMYMRRNAQRICWRKDGYSGRWRPIRLKWDEHSEPDLIKEYVDGVGTPEFNRRRWKS